DRKDRGLGHFIEREEIERRVPTRATDILRGTPAIRLADIGGGRRDVRLNVQTTFGNDCEPRIFVDGMLARGRGVVELDEKSAPERSLDFLVNITDVEAIEVYARTSAVPAQYGGLDTACGVIVVWTRRN
ncbi:MAG: hypothetical protein V2J02_08780, partial [Pseudomonadales bacterium]|nr:hypothetical protein [Pseudomonadales bacterium]